MKIKTASLLLVTLAVAALATAGEAQRAAGSNVARTIVTSSATGDGQTAATIAVDLRNVWIENHPAVLGGYVVRLDFDPKRLAFVEAGGGEGLFSDAPFATNSAAANHKGAVTIAAAQTNRDAPAGLVRIARVVFRELAPGGARTLRVRILSAAAPIGTSENGPLVAHSLPVAAN